MNSYQKQYADALRMAIKRKTKKDADEWLDQQKVSDGKTRIAMKKAYIEGRLSNLTDESIVSSTRLWIASTCQTGRNTVGKNPPRKYWKNCTTFRLNNSARQNERKEYNDHFDHSQRIARLRKEHLGAEACRFEYGNRQLGRFA